ncbi:MAG: magnesium chelatase domain-containing protein [Acidimicrobiales bacterium]
MSKTGGGRGTNQYAVRGQSKAKARVGGAPPSAKRLRALKEMGEPSPLLSREGRYVGITQPGGRKVEVHVADGLPSFSVLGVGQGSVRQTRDRVRAAMVNSGLAWPLQRVTVNLAPRSERELRPEDDLPIAIGLLEATKQVPVNSEGRVKQWQAELGLDGSIRWPEGKGLGEPTSLTEAVGALSHGGACKVCGSTSPDVVAGACQVCRWRNGEDIGMVTLADECSMCGRTLVGEEHLSDLCPACRADLSPEVESRFRVPSP